MAPRTENHYSNISYARYAERNAKPPPRETLTQQIVKQLPDIIAGSVFLPEEAGLIGATAGARIGGVVGARTAAKIGGTSAIKAIERQAAKAVAQGAVKAEGRQALAQAESLGKDVPMAPRFQEAQTQLVKHAHVPFFNNIVKTPPAERAAFYSFKNDMVDIDVAYGNKYSTDEIATFATRDGKDIYMHHTGAFDAPKKARAIAEGWTGAGTTGLTPSARQGIEKLDLVLKEHPNARVHLSGYSKGGGAVHDIMIHRGNDPRIVEAITIAPNTSSMSNAAGRTMARMQGTTASINKKMKSFSMIEDPISDPPFAHGETIQLDHATARGLDQHKLDNIFSPGVKTASARSVNPMTLRDYVPSAPYGTGITLYDIMTDKQRDFQQARQSATVKPQPTTTTTRPAEPTPTPPTTPTTRPTRPTRPPAKRGDRMRPTFKTFDEPDIKNPTMRFV